MRHFLYSIERTDVVQGVDTGRQPTVQAEDLIVNQSSEWEVVKQVGKIFPDVCISIFAKAFIVESVDLGDLAGLVVSTEDCDTLRISNFESNK